MLRVDRGFWGGKIFTILVRYMSLLSTTKREQRRCEELATEALPPTIYLTMIIEGRYFSPKIEKLSGAKD